MILMALMAALGPVATIPMTCGYEDNRSKVVDAPCTATQLGDYADHLYRVGGRNFTVIHLGNNEDGSKRVRINGEPATGYERWRGSRIYVTGGGALVFEVRDRGGPKFPVR